MTARALSIAHSNSGTLEGGNPCLESRPPYGPKHAQWGSYLDSKLASSWPSHPVMTGKQACHVLCEAWYCPGHTQNFDQKRPLPREAHYHGKPDVALAVEGSIQHHQFQLFPSLSMMIGTPYHDWGAMVTVCGFDARICKSLPLPAAHTSTTITVKQHEARLTTEDSLWRHSASSDWGPIFCTFSITHGGVACDPKSMGDTWWIA